MTIVNRGNVRGGCNSHGRLHLAAYVAGVFTPEELEAIRQHWAAVLGLKDGGPSGTGYEMTAYGMAVCFRCATRRHFALVPLFVRMAVAVGDCRAQLWDALDRDDTPRANKSEYSLATEPAEFWREVAMAQAYIIES